MAKEQLEKTVEQAETKGSFAKFRQFWKSVLKSLANMVGSAYLKLQLTEFRI